MVNNNKLTLIGILAIGSILFIRLIVTIPGYLFTTIDKTIIEKHTCDSIIIGSNQHKIKIINSDTLQLIKEAFMNTKFENRLIYPFGMSGLPSIDVKMYLTNGLVSRFRLTSKHGRFTYIRIDQNMLKKNSRLIHIPEWDISNEFGDLISYIYYRESSKKSYTTGS